MNEFFNFMYILFAVLTFFACLMLFGSISFEKGIRQGNIQVASGEVVCNLETKGIGYNQTKSEWNCQKVDK